MEQQPKDIYEYITAEEMAYNQGISVIDGYDWSMKEHIRLSTLYKNSIYATGKDDNKPFKNITRPILNLQYRAEDIDLKDVVLYVDDEDQYHLSFLVKKYHDDVFAVEHDLDTFFDEVKESKIDYGGGLAMKGTDGMPATLPLQSIAFCDQSDLLSGPIAFKHFFSPDQLMDMEASHWGEASFGATVKLDELITLARTQKVPDRTDGKEVKTPGKYIEVYVVMGSLPTEYLDKEGDKPSQDGSYTRQLQVVAFYRPQTGNKQGVTLFKGKQRVSPLKLLSRDKIYGRALGLGGAEELFEPQVWTNYDVIRMKDLLDAASKVILQTDDPTLAAKHPSGLKNLDNLEILEVADGKNVSQVDTVPRNMVLFEKSVAEWEAHAQQMGGATDALLGQNPSSGTPFKLQDLIVAQGQGLHDYRRGKNATFFAEIYRDWIIPQIARKLASGAKWLSELSLEDLQYVADCLVRNAAKKYEDELVLSGQPVDPAKTEQFKQKVRDEFTRKGSKHFLELLKGELKDVTLKVKVNVANKQKDLAGMVDKLSNVVRFAFSTYNQQTGTFAVFEDPRMAKLFNEILEYSGLSPLDFYQQPQPKPVQQGPVQPTPQLQPGQGQQLPAIKA